MSHHADSPAELARESSPPSFPGSTIPSGSLRLDIALGTGGYPSSAIVEINGPPSSGKSCLCQHAIAEAQRLGGSCAYIDSDRSLSLDFARRCGVQIEDLYYAEPGCTEQALGILETLARSGAFTLIVLDSLTTLIPASELSGLEIPLSDRHNQELLSSSLSRVSESLKRTGAVVIFTRHTAARPSAVYHDLSTNPRRLALKLHAGFCIRLKNQEYVYSAGQIIGSKIQARLTSHKFRPLLNTIDFDIIYQQGINKTAEILALGIFIREIQWRPDSYYYRKVRMGQTLSQALDFLQENRRVRNEVERNIRRAFMPHRIIAAT
jgi:recombination protein RecA